ncbi:MAG: hypothetical protein ACD_24C00112G0001 [uncultured bacterium]|nr:MAG: hypothetical protein ACD_24C00112G0001 [uncultured bacterium]
MTHLRNFLLVSASIFILLLVTVVVSAQINAQTAKENVKKHSEYPLPYPGILPGNPLYQLKMVRDRVFEILIVDPFKKADFYLLQADKRLAAGESLITKGNATLGEETISKGEKYFELAVELTKQAKNKGKDTKDLTDRLARSWDKHDEILTDLAVRGQKEIIEGINSSHKLLNTTKQKMVKYFNNTSYSLPFPTESPTIPTVIPIE